MEYNTKKAFRGNLFALCLIVFQVMGGRIILPLMRPMIKNLSYGGLMILTQLMFLILPTIIYFLVTKANVKDTLRLNKIYISEVFIMILIAILSQPIGAFFATISSFFAENVVEQAVGLLKGSSYLELITIMAITPAICEEITMRGVVLKGMDNHNIIKSSLVSGVIFGMLHLTGSQFLYATFLGFIFAYIVRITNSLFTGIIMHLVFNGFNMTIGYLSEKFINKAAVEVAKNQASTINLETISVLATLAIIACVIIFSLIGYVKKNRIKIEGKEVMDLRIEGNKEFRDKDPIINLPFIILCIFYIIMMILT